MSEAELIELLADKEHASWARWMDWLFLKGHRELDGAVTLSAEYVAALQRQIDAPYAALSEQEKQYDREEVLRLLPIIRRFAQGGAARPEEAV